MPSRKNHRKDSQAGSERPKPLWQKPLLWIAALIVAALGTALTNVIQPILNRTITPLVEVGDPIWIKTELRNAMEDVTFPSGLTLSEQDVEMLGALNRTADQAAWLEKRGGIVAGKRTLVVTLRGERADPVRITDIRDASECAPVDRGTLFRLVTGRGATPQSIKLAIEVGNPTRDAFWVDAEKGESKPYFPERTITLRKDEEEVLVIDLYPPQPEQACRVRLQMTVLERDGEHKQLIAPERLSVMDVEPYKADVESAYDLVYLSGWICQRVVPGQPSWYDQLTYPCGSGNRTSRLG